MTPSGTASHPRAASLCESAASSVTASTEPTPGVARHADTVSRANAIASSRRSSVGSPTNRDFPTAGGFTGTSTTCSWSFIASILSGIL